MHREMHIVACAYIILERTRYTHNMSTLMDVVLHSVQVFCRAASEKRRSDATTKMQRRDNKKSDDAVMEEYGGENDAQDVGRRRDYRIAHRLFFGFFTNLAGGRSSS